MNGNKQEQFKSEAEEIRERAKLLLDKLKTKTNMKAEKINEWISQIESGLKNLDNLKKKKTFNNQKSKIESLFIELEGIISNEEPQNPEGAAGEFAGKAKAVVKGVKEDGKKAVKTVVNQEGGKPANIEEARTVVKVSDEQLDKEKEDFVNGLKGKPENIDKTGINIEGVKESLCKLKEEKIKAIKNIIPAEKLKQQDPYLSVNNFKIVWETLWRHSRLKEYLDKNEDKKDEVGNLGYEINKEIEDVVKIKNNEIKETIKAERGKPKYEKILNELEKLFNKRKDAGATDLFHKDSNVDLNGFLKNNLPYTSDLNDLSKEQQEAIRGKCTEYEIELNKLAKSSQKYKNNESKTAESPETITEGTRMTHEESQRLHKERMDKLIKTKESDLEELEREEKEREKAETELLKAKGAGEKEEVKPVEAMAPEIKEGAGEKEDGKEKTGKGFWSKEVGWQVIKTMVGTAASIGGVKSVYDVPVYFRQRFKTRGIFGMGKGMEGAVNDVLSASYETRGGFKYEEEYKFEIDGKKFEGKRRLGERLKSLREAEELEKKKDRNEEEEKKYQELLLKINQTESFKVREAIDDLNKRLKLTREGGQKGSEQRKFLAKLLRENRIKEVMNKEDRGKEMEKILDLYTTTKITGMQAARETLNTAFVASGAYLLRGASYGFLDAAERYQKLSKEAERKGEKRGKFGLLIRTIVGGIKETFQEAVWHGGKKKTGKQKALDFAKSWGRIVRYAGIGGAALHPESLTHPVDKVLDALQGKVGLGEAAGNFKGNIERMADFYKKLFTGELFKNYGEILTGAYAGEAKTGVAGQADAVGAQEADTNIKFSPEEFRKQYPGLKYEMGIKDAEAKLEEAVKATTGVETTETAAPAISPEQTELATVGKGEGMWHAVRRQIEDLMNKDPEAFAKRFGLAEENFDSPEEVKKVLDRETMELLVKNKYINLDRQNKTEIRISNPGTRVILGEDNKINIVDESGVQAKVYETELGKVEGRGGLPKELPDSGAAADVLRDAGWVKSGVEAVEGKPGAQWARIDYPNDYKLRMVAIDADGNGAPEEIRILNENDEIIKSSILDSQKGENVKDFVDRAKAESDILIETRNSAFKNIVGDKIIMAQAKEAGINVFTKEDLLPAAKEKLTFWVGHANLLHTPEAAKEYFTLSEATKIDYKSPDFQDYFRRLPADLDGTQKEGYMEVHAGMPAQKEGGLIKLFGEEIRKSGSVDEKIEKFFTEKNDIFIIHDACGKKGFDILITKDKIGVDGPGRWNWGTKGWFGDIRPVHDFNNLGIKTAKTIIENMSKELENRQPAVSP